MTVLVISARRDTQSHNHKLILIKYIVKLLVCACKKFSTHEKKKLITESGHYKSNGNTAKYDEYTAILLS